MTSITKFSMKIVFGKGLRHLFLTALLYWEYSGFNYFDTMTANRRQYTHIRHRFCCRFSGLKNPSLWAGAQQSLRKSQVNPPYKFIKIKYISNKSKPAVYNISSKKRNSPILLKQPVLLANSYFLPASFVDKTAHSLYFSIFNLDLFKLK